MAQINLLATRISRNVTIMEICGGHTNVIMQYGIREILPKNVRLVSGPGCPVCVSSQYDIDCVIGLAQQKIPVAVYGDMMKVPGSFSTLEKEKAKGADVFEVYSAEEAIALKRNYNKIVFFGVGFETTAPMTAYLLKNNVCVYSVHKLIVPAMLALNNGEVRIDGFINPGHVSAVIGTNPYHEVQSPQVIAGFTAERILRAIRLLLSLILGKKQIVINGYPEAVNEAGNRAAQKMLKSFFYVADSEWRGLGKISKSGLEVKNDALNAKIIYKAIMAKVQKQKKTACRCEEVLKGLIDPSDCPLYGKMCTPDSPSGACMVSAEGSCSIAYRYGT